MQTTILGPWKVTANMEKITLEREADIFTFHPGEAERITKILGIALQMRKMESLPSFIPYSPFRVKFFEDDTLALQRVDDYKSSLHLTWNDVDELIQTIHKSIPISVNDTVQSQSISKRRPAVMDTGEPYL
jgi:hypothetical protein